MRLVRRTILPRQPVTIIVPKPRRPHHDLIAMLQRLLPNYTLSIDVRAVQTAKITQPKPIFPLLNNTMLLRHNAVQKLNRIVGVAPKRIGSGQLNNPLPFRGDYTKTRHWVRSLV